MTEIIPGYTYGEVNPTTFERFVEKTEHEVISSTVLSEAILHFFAQLTYHDFSKLGFFPSLSHFLGLNCNSVQFSFFCQLNFFASPKTFNDVDSYIKAWGKE